MAKLVLGVAAAVLVALLAGWLWGASGRSAISRELQTAQLRSDLLAARAAVLDARVAIYSVNFGEASQHLEDARGLLRRSDEQLESLARSDDSSRVQSALTSVDEAQRLAGKLDQGANARAGEAAKVISDLLAGAGG